MMEPKNRLVPLKLEFVPFFINFSDGKMSVYENFRFGQKKCIVFCFLSAEIWLPDCYSLFLHQ